MAFRDILLLVDDHAASAARIAAAIDLATRSNAHLVGLRLLAVGSPKRHPAYPDVPTVGEIIGETFDADTVFGVFVPAGTPKDVVARLNKDISAALQSADLRGRITGIGAQELILGADAFAARLRAEHERMGALVKETGLRVE